ncbi:MAG: LAGLIDADG family homing endonuclease [Patescibacteria group bacterium]|nr:LAGLIDADG family homing endonuclease [Patescibacteria group bacterium]
MKSKKIKGNRNLQAYIVGLALGDGNLSNPNGRSVRLRISCDLKYPKLLRHIIISLQKFLPDNKISVIRRKERCVDISCYSNLWPEILGWEAGEGSKHLQEADIPSWIMSRKSYAIACLKGLIETDGSIYKDRGYDMVMFVSIIPKLAKSVFKCIKLLGFQPHIYYFQPKGKYNSSKIFHIRISKNTEDFLKLVKPIKS